MPDLTLGPVIGRIGGASEPLDLTPDTPTSDLTVDLPDGQWTIVVAINAVAQGNETLSVGGEAVLTASISTTQHSGVHAVAHHRSGTVAITCGNRWRIGTVNAYPEPT